MRILIQILLVISLVWAEEISAQTNNLWTVYNQNSAYSESAYYFDQNGKLIFVPSLNQQAVDISRGSWPVALSNWNGSANITSDIHDVFINGVRIGNSNVHQPEHDNPDSGYVGRASYTLAPCDTSNFLLIIPYTKEDGLRFFNDTGKSFVSYILIKQDSTHPTGYSIPNGAALKRVIFPNQTVHGCALTRDKTGELILVIRTTNNLYSYKWTDTGNEFVFLDSIHFPFLSLSNDPQYLDQKKYAIRKFNTYNSPFISAKGDKVIIEASYEIYTIPGSKVVEVVMAVFELDFNANTGVFSNKKTLYEKSWDISKPYPSGKFIAIRDVCFSPDGSQLYFAGYEYEYNDNIKLPAANARGLSYQFCNFLGSKLIQTDNLGQNSTDIYFSSNAVGNFNLNFLGELIFSEGGGQISRIKKANLTAPACDITLNTDQLPNGYETTVSFRGLYDFNRVTHQTTYSCFAEVRFSNKPDPSINFTSFKWHFTKEDGTEFISTDKNPIISYTKSGDYPYKLFSQSTDGNGYGEWYIDTLRIRIPEKPVASFTASDTVVCRYADVLFNNNSFAQDSTVNTFTWHFGDGVTNNLFEPSHAYSNTGTYSVSLFYSNGYCDSTLVKNQYIQVVDAPRPGIDITPTDGCAPLLVSITDTQTVSVVKKEYFFSEVGIWQEEVNSVVSHQFDVAGDYMIVEYLKGYSGCVVYDTAYVHVRKGLSDKDTFNVLNATLEGLDATVCWKGNPAAIEYTIYKQPENGNLVIWKTGSDTFFTDENYKTGDSYFINGIDSCGGMGVRYRPGKPVVLSGVVIGMNESAELDFTKYESWEGGILYDVQKWKNGAWMMIHQTTNLGIISDYKFSEDDTFRACYRIVSYHPTNPDIQSVSNVRCLELVPQIWVPNAFTPNKNGLNDNFFPVMLGVTSIEMQIFNQWGQLVFAGENSSWDGTYLNSDAPSGVYLVMYSAVTAQGARIHNKKVIHLIR